MSPRRLDELFDAAQDVEPERREEWLDAACAGDAELRSRLQRLLDADARADGILESGRSLIREALAEEAQAPCNFGVWRVLGPLGTGGMGAVWLAERDDAGFVQRAAIKQVAWPTPGLLQRFRNERQILARLEHPGIARLIDGGVDDGGCPYLAMEHVEGTRIDAWVREHALDVRGIVRLLLQVCDAMQFAHRNLVVHSDIKPSNILVGEDGKPRLLDFGIARVLSDDSADATRTATRLMTPDYAAPEWLAGAPVTTAVDIYALGVLAYELLSGSKPYRVLRGGARPAPQLPDVPTRPPSAALAMDAPHRRVRQRACRGDLDRVVLTAMARDPARRYATVEAFAADLRNWLDGRAVTAAGDSAWYRLRKFVARNRVATAAVALAALALIAATGFSLQQAYFARQQMRVALRQSARADAVRDFLNGVFEQANPETNDGKPLTARGLLEEGEAQLSDIEASDAVRADLILEIASLYWNIGEEARAKVLLERALRLAQRPGVPAEIPARVLLWRGRMANSQRQYDKAVDNARRALAYAEAGGEDAADEASTARSVLANALRGQGNLEAAMRILREGITADTAALGADSMDVINKQYLLASTLVGLARYRDAAATARQEIAAATAAFGEDHGLVIDGYEILGQALGYRGKFVESERAFRKALDIAVRIYGDGHRETMIARNDWLWSLENQGRAGEALQARLSMLPLVKKDAAERPDGMAYFDGFIAGDYLMLGRLGDAVRSARASLAAWKKIQGSNDSLDSLRALNTLGTALMLSGRFDDAIATFESERALVVRHHSPQVAVVAGNLGDAYRRAGRRSDALRTLHEAAALLARGKGPSSPWYPALQSQLAEAEIDSGNATDAERAAGAALAAARKLLPAGNYKLGASLFALARAKLALRKGSEAETLLREALAVRSPPYPADDPRALEVKVALIRALELQDKKREAAPLRVAVAPLLAASGSPYLADLRRRIAPD